MTMLYRLFFNRVNPTKKKRILDSRGVIIGSFLRDGRKNYVYMLDDFFVEVQFVDDSSYNEIERAYSFSDYKRLEKYMEESLHRLY